VRVAAWLTALTGAGVTVYLWRVAHDEELCVKAALYFGVISMTLVMVAECLKYARILVLRIDELAERLDSTTEPDQRGL